MKPPKKIVSKEILHKYRIKKALTIRKLVKQMNASIVAIQNTIKR